MSLPPEWERKREELLYGSGRATRKGDGRRFKPLNAIVVGGWVGTLTLRQLRVWLTLYQFADAGCRVCISHGTIARYSGMRREHAARATASLEELGLVRVVTRGRTFGKRGKRTANVYELLAPEPLAISAAGGTNGGAD